jgi:hypothetical protein
MRRFAVFGRRSDAREARQLDIKLGAAAGMML